MKKLRKLLAVSIIIATFAACDKNEAPFEEPTPVAVDFESLYSQTDYNLDLRDFALAVNEAVNTNKSFRKLIKEEVYKMFDGDCNVLLSHIVDAKVENYQLSEEGMPMRVAGSVSVRDLLNSSFQTVQEKAVANGSLQMSNRQKAPKLSLVDQLSSAYPALQIAVPFLEEQLENENYIPPVVFLPAEYSESYTEFLPAIKGDMMYPVDAVRIPDYACIVICENERMPVEQDDVPPPVPTSFTGSITDFGITLSWTMPTETGETNTSGYKIYRKIDNGNYDLVYTSNSHYNRSYLDNNIEFNKVLYYYLVAYNSYQTATAVYCNNGVGIVVNSIPNAVTEFSVKPTGIGVAQLRWAFENSSYNGSVSLFKKNEETTHEFPSSPFASFNYNNGGNIVREHVEYGIASGTRWEYKIERKNATGEASDPKYDLLYMPYRNVKANSKVYVRGIKCTDNSKIESWRGAPEYKVQILKAKWDGTKYTTDVANEIRIDLPKGTKDNEYTWFGKDQGLITNSWRPGFDGENWYDVYTFHIREYDGGIGWEDISLSAEALEKGYKTSTDIIKGKSPAKAPAVTNEAVVIIGVALTAASVTAQVLSKLVKKADENIGFTSLTYYDDPCKEVEIQAADKDCKVYVTFSDKDTGH